MARSGTGAILLFVLALCLGHAILSSPGAFLGPPRQALLPAAAGRTLRTVAVAAGSEGAPPEEESEWVDDDAPFISPVFLWFGSIIFVLGGTLYAVTANQGSPP
eukprot:CAMPEP_0171094056 /NCGR_PEP_ID=MMETSP0766_2-20121228/39745_1 /TAXON_ID=439317 /ORGANISM="Gambierdiscus australes, Strain CAWD 149" /LENGTH=103 /DNA_ID=CAMNT_0011552603 /DNA_START=51 /DNA_END=362 /DNA_ORIENTATION=-